MGSWKSIIEMEDILTLEEVNLLATAAKDREHRQNKFMAALKGIDIDENQSDDAFDKIKMKAQADLAGKSEERYVLEDVVGIDFETDEG